MICKPCRRLAHEECKGGTWCDCAHKPVALFDPPPPGVQRLPVIDLRS